MRMEMEVVEGKLWWVDLLKKMTMKDERDDGCTPYY